MKNSKLKWNVYRNDFNDKEITTFNIFNHSSFNNDVEKLLKKKLDKVNFSKELKSIAMYYFWSRSEYEIIITSWPPYISKEELDRLNTEDVRYRTYVNLEAGKKIDIYQQLYLNWDRFVDYIYSYGN